MFHHCHVVLLFIMILINYVFIIILLINKVKRKDPKKDKFKELQETLSYFTNDEFVSDLYLKINYSHKMQFNLGSKYTSSQIGFGSRLKNDKKMSNFIKFRLCS